VAVARSVPAAIAMAAAMTMATATATATSGRGIRALARQRWPVQRVAGR